MVTCIIPFSRASSSRDTLATGRRFEHTCSVANTAAKPQNWATFDPNAAANNLVPWFDEPITVNVISMGLPEIGCLEFWRCLRHGLANF